MKLYFKKNKGFTLIELLVTISIISLLSSIVLTTLSNAKSTAKDAAAKAGVREFEKLLQMEYNDNGNYDYLQSYAWVPTSSCSSLFSSSSTYVVQARNICSNILSNTYASSVWPGSSIMFYSLSGASSHDSQKYSIMVLLSSGKWFCVGSSGISDNVTDWWTSPYP